MTERESAFSIVNIQVTEEDIEKGIPRSILFCPVARAISRHLAEGAHVIVYADLITLIRGTELFDKRPPPSVTRFNLLFDRGTEVQPFSFKLKLPRWILKERTK